LKNHLVYVSLMVQ